MKRTRVALLCLDVLRGAIIGVALCYALATLWGSDATIVFRYVGY